MCGLMPEKRKQNDDWNRHSKQPKKNSSTHDRPLLICRGVELGRPRYPGATNRLPLLLGHRRKPEQHSLSWPSAANRLPFPVDPNVLCEIPNLGFRFREIVGVQMTSAGHRVDAPTHEPAYRGTTWAVK